MPYFGTLLGGASLFRGGGEDLSGDWLGYRQEKGTRLA